jgi:hypothetical protein
VIVVRVVINFALLEAGVGVSIPSFVRVLITGALQYHISFLIFFNIFEEKKKGNDKKETKLTFLVESIENL